MGTNAMQWFRGTLLTAVLLTPPFAHALPSNGAPGQGQQSTSTHDAVVIVLDDSGSMSEGMGWGGLAGQNKMRAAKAALKTVLGGIPSTTWVGLLALNAGWQHPLGPLDASRLDAVIDSIDTSGGTPLARNIKAGADRLMAEREKQLGYGSYRLLVVTDGQETDDNRAIEQYPPEVRARGLTLDVIGVAMGEEHILAKYAHTYRNAADPGSLERAIREVFAERVDPNDQTGGGDAFELVAGLDPGVAQQAMLALARAGNHPIGEQPPASPSEAPSGDGSGGTAGVPVPSGSHATGPTGCSGCVSAGDGYGGLGTLLVMGALWIVVSLRRRR